MSRSQYEPQWEKIERMKQGLVPLVACAQSSSCHGAVEELLEQMAVGKYNAQHFIACTTHALSLPTLPAELRPLYETDLKAARELIEVIEAYELRLTTHRTLH